MRARRSPPAAAWASRRTGLAPRLTGSDRAVRDAEGAPRRRRGRSRTGWGRGGESACPHPPPASLGPPPSRDSTSLHLLSAAPVASASPAYPRSRVPLPHHSPLAPETQYPRPCPASTGLLTKPWSWGPALTSAAGPAPRLSPGLKGPGPAAGPRSPSRSSSFPSPCSPSTGIQALARLGSLPFSIATANPTPVSPSPGRRRPREHGAGREGGGAGDRGSSRAEGERRVQGKTGRGEGRGRPERAPPTTRAPGAAPDPGPSLDRPRRGRA